MNTPLASFFCLCALACGCLLPCLAEADGVEPAACIPMVLNWNHGWEFRRVGDGETAWQPCHLPHSEAAPYFLGSSFREGVVEYRKELVVPASWRGRCVELEIESAFQCATILVDGQVAGSHRGGYTSFRIDLTPWVPAGRHELLIRVDNTWQPTLAPRAGEHVFAAGLYRDVRLHVLPPVHLQHRGLVVTSPEVSSEQACVRVEAKLHNRSAEPRRVSARARLAGAELASAPVSLELPAHSEGTLTIDLPPLRHPRLWSPADPHLYELVFECEAEQQPLWSERVPVGLRWFEWRADEGFFLNGEHLFLLGANVHQGQAGWGDGVTNASHERDVLLMKEAGFNFIRGSHYPHDPAFLAACDRLGMLYWCEGGIWGMGGAKEGMRGWKATAIPTDREEQEAFFASAAAQLREMVADARNHPCVIAWSVSNEPFFVPVSLMPEVRRQLKELVHEVRQADPTRPVAIGGAQRGEIDHLADITGYNGDGARLFTRPGVPSIVSEYGSVSEERPGTSAPHWGDFANKRPAWRAGAAIWCGFDHGSIWESGQHMGIVDFFRLPKQSWYWYRQALRGLPPEPVPPVGAAAGIRLTSDRQELESCRGEDDALIRFQLLAADGSPVSAELPVTLRISGVGEFPTGKEITFAAGSPIRLAAGAGGIVFRSHFSGESTITASAPGVPPACLRITCHDADASLRYVAGQSRETPSRPCGASVLLPASAAAPAGELALNRPCRASSAEAFALFATDGEPTTAWQAEPTDLAPWLQLDLEFIVALWRVEAEGTAPLHTLISQDGQQWQPFTPGAHARYVRLYFPRAARVYSLFLSAYPQEP